MCDSPLLILHEKIHPHSLSMNNIIIWTSIYISNFRHKMDGSLQTRFLQSLHGLYGVGEFLIGLGNGVSLNETSDCLAKKLDIIKGVVTLYPLVKVGIECNLLDVLGVT